MDDAVGTAWTAAVARLRAAGVAVEERALPFLEYVPEVTAKGGVIAIEAYTWHKSLLAEAGDRYDPRVRTRILFGEAASLADYQAVLRRRRSLMTRAELELAGYDAIVTPTIPIVPPPIAAFDDDKEFARLNLLMLRNPTVANLLDGCAISLPAGAPAGPPAGLQIIGRTGEDQRLLAVGRSLEAIVRPRE
jgi:aspartyl-tRNA(Asn)/glutamyl-tRNA(Gln) amidotransferase subunit A